ncbi:hypothetical protein PC9H_009031 [Pleurotus ostreatus]|uniref:Uncharacterized protein n=1 Tax=Pleurotus ostreatus TaxID=5322 RepID=A0A8H7DR56_PLEOS|nr:uncharacterized protein PC9H_009031 [Pleurotus ostreatus]KAF7426662.1 hypothetical protein PC9H_009031 [Pleurotus ostreatus]
MNEVPTVYSYGSRASPVDDDNNNNNDVLLPSTTTTLSALRSDYRLASHQRLHATPASFASRRCKHAHSPLSTQHIVSQSGGLDTQIGCSTNASPSSPRIREHNPTSCNRAPALWIRRPSVSYARSCPYVGINVGVGVGVRARVSAAVAPIFRVEYSWLRWYIRGCVGIGVYICVHTLAFLCSSRQQAPGFGFGIDYWMGGKASSYTVPTTRCPLPVAHYPLPTTRCPPHVAITVARRARPNVPHRTFHVQASALQHANTAPAPAQTLTLKRRKRRRK